MDIEKAKLWAQAFSSKQRKSKRKKAFSSKQRKKPKVKDVLKRKTSRMEFFSFTDKERLHIFINVFYTNHPKNPRKGKRLELMNSWATLMLMTSIRQISVLSEILHVKREDLEDLYYEFLRSRP